ncbi:hypothetical protein BaRGS_00036158 [Batillaria attramentaria]|uniref:Uncharacterized protein n=1 Tax=Batillaria attramentaria TaxID=370345 RepID=A0ABD0JC80_9CAEN
MDGIFVFTLTDHATCSSIFVQETRSIIQLASVPSLTPFRTPLLYMSVMSWLVVSNLGVSVIFPPTHLSNTSSSQSISKQKNILLSVSSMFTPLVAVRPGANLLWGGRFHAHRPNSQPEVQ